MDDSLALHVLQVLRVVSQVNGVNLEVVRFASLVAAAMFVVILLIGQVSWRWLVLHDLLVLKVHLHLLLLMLMQARLGLVLCRLVDL